ncbi:MAG: hypothetical protein HY834_18270 [Devosia nanyangense]|uniref:Uncharacterized protein n=1 Tax=Devosia nanyangense TaxID=1228055 RepID=A0A933NY76_9HYPH|nr:hypothetical protein [Devosia nanyangense]
MDRVISLLAALVGLIALAAAIVVHTNVDAERQQMATDLAQMRLSIGLTSPQPVVTPAPVGPPADDGTAEALLSLQNRIATLEQVTTNQAAELEAARTALAAISSPPPASPLATAAAEHQPPVPKAVTADGPTSDCIPLGTRFMASAGDSFPICKTKAVVRVSAVENGSATIAGPGPITAGGFGPLEAAGCTVMVFSADSSGYAELRVTCQ